MQILLAIIDNFFFEVQQRIITYLPDFYLNKSSEIGRKPVRLMINYIVQIIIEQQRCNQTWSEYATFVNDLYRNRESWHAPH